MFEKRALLHLTVSANRGDGKQQKRSFVAAAAAFVVVNVVATVVEFD